ncbi:uncharacterized protein LOC116840941 isoform X2 [Odontomachus brunneus]|uniref:uncharacterized protein LOC116840941 isoform X2 n=1 Tax=Odontomachus brunneus TaxID=486640 RepID=UPI0013F1944E|nr:uncharacterized protein LOC116840941 isoform X2 [Odontomachus brunneus]
MKESVLGRYTRRYLYVRRGIYPCAQLLHRARVRVSAPGAEGGYIDVSRGSVLPFYPNVISAKYENSYVAAVYTSHPRAERYALLASARRGVRDSRTWAATTGKYNAFLATPSATRVACYHAISLLYKDGASTNKSQASVHCGSFYVCLRGSFSDDKGNNWMKEKFQMYLRNFWFLFN